MAAFGPGLPSAGSCCTRESRGTVDAGQQQHTFRQKQQCPGTASSISLEQPWILGVQSQPPSSASAPRGTTRAALWGHQRNTAVDVNSSVPHCPPSISMQPAEAQHLLHKVSWVASGCLQLNDACGAAWLGLLVCLYCVATSMWGPAVLVASQPYDDDHHACANAPQQVVYACKTWSQGQSRAMQQTQVKRGLLLWCDTRAQAIRRDGWHTKYAELVNQGSNTALLGSSGLKTSLVECSTRARAHSSITASCPHP